MGMYVNPPEQSKEAFLAANGTVIGAQALHGLITDPVNVGVCLVDNGIFTAAGVTYDDQMVVAFTRIQDQRQRVYYSVPRAALREIGCEI